MHFGVVQQSCSHHGLMPSAHRRRRLTLQSIVQVEDRKSYNNSNNFDESDSSDHGAIFEDMDSCNDYESEKVELRHSLLEAEANHASD